jgi:large subunit ribosomal protein L18
MRPEKKQRLLQRRRWRIRQKVRGTPDRPRMSVHFSGKHIYVQFVDDVAGRTLAAASTRSKVLPAGESLKSNTEGARRVGGLAAEAARARGIGRVVFDRGGARYRGKQRREPEKAAGGKGGKGGKGEPAEPRLRKIEALAEAARKGGLEF